MKNKILLLSLSAILSACSDSETSNSSKTNSETKQAQKNSCISSYIGKPCALLTAEIVKNEFPRFPADDAFDVAGYVESLKRPHKEGRDKDFPNEKFRPADYPVPEYYNGDKNKLERAKYGQFN